MTDSTLNILGLRKMGDFALETESLEEAYLSILHRLAFHYGLLLKPGKSLPDFREEILKPLSESTPDAPATFDLTYFTDHSKATFSLFFRYLLDGSVHALYAHQADDEGKHAKAWQHISSAMYALGMLEGTIILEPAMAHIIASRSASGAKKRTEKYAPLRALARELASKKTHMSKRGAVFSIMDEVLAFGESLDPKVTLSKTQTERTITSWLEGMSFGSKREL